MESKAYYENIIIQSQKRQDFIYREITELKQKIAKLNTQLDYLQSDIDDSREHLDNGDYAE